MIFCAILLCMHNYLYIMLKIKHDIHNTKALFYLLTYKTIIKN